MLGQSRQINRMTLINVAQYLFQGEVVEYKGRTLTRKMKISEFLTSFKLIFCIKILSRVMVFFVVIVNW